MTVAEAYCTEVEHYYKRNSTAAIIDNAMFALIRLGLSPYTILPFYLKRLTDSTFLIGLIPAIFILGFAAPQLIIARHLQHTRRRKHILVLSSVEQRVCILGLLLLTIFQNRLPNQLVILIFFILYFLYNLGRGCYSPTWIDFLGRAVPCNRGKILGIGSFYGGILNLLGTVLLTGLLAILPYPEAITAIIAISFVSSLVSLVAIMSWHDILPPVGKGEVETGTEKPLPRKDFQHYLVWRAVIVGIEMMLPFYAIYGLEKFNLPDSYLGIFTAILTLSDAMMNPLWGWLGDKVGYLRIVIMASFLGCLGAVMAAVSNNPFLYLAIFLLNGMMLSGQQLGNINIVYEFAVKRKIPTYTAINQVILSPLSGLAPVVGGYLVGIYGNTWCCLLAGAIGLIGVIGMGVNVRSPRMENPQGFTGQGG